MSVAASITAAVNAAFAAAGDLAQTVTVRRSALGAYSTTTGTVSESTTDYAFQGVVTADTTAVDGQTIVRTVKLMLRPGPVEPEARDHVVVGAEVFRITSVGALRPGAAVLAWLIEATP